MQETHLGPAKYYQLKSDWNGEIFLAAGMVQRDGVMLLRKNIAPEIEILKTDPKGKYMILNITNSNVTIGAIYAPSRILKEKQQERKTFFYRIKGLMRKRLLTDANLTLVGDFNTTLESLERTTGVNTDQVVQNKFRGNLSEYDLEDHWCIQNPKEKLYTLYHKRTDTRAQLYRTYTATKMRLNIKITHKINSFSDHYQAVVIKWTNKNFLRGKGY